MQNILSKSKFTETISDARTGSNRGSGQHSGISVNGRAEQSVEQQSSSSAVSVSGSGGFEFRKNLTSSLTLRDAGILPVERKLLLKTWSGSIP